MRGCSAFDQLWNFIYLSMTHYLSTSVSPCICVTWHWQNSVRLRHYPTAPAACLFPLSLSFSFHQHLQPLPLQTSVQDKSPPLCLWSTSLGLSLADVFQVEELKINFYVLGQELFAQPVPMLRKCRLEEAIRSLRSMHKRGQQYCKVFGINLQLQRSRDKLANWEKCLHEINPNMMY